MFSKTNNRTNLEKTKGRCKDYSRIVDTLFEKKFELPLLERHWEQLDPAVCFTSASWDVEKMQKLKTILNACKNNLNDCSLNEWRAHTKKRNPAGEVCWRLQQVVHPEFLTQAWTKFYECAFEYKIIPEEALRDNKLVSLHLCEAPGAFISSLNHYLRLHYIGIEWQWKASTLNPYYEGNSPSHMIADDRFMFHTLEHWEFGKDYTGNLMSWENSQAIIHNTKKLGKVLLVTADGSIDCVETPDEQESVTSPLHYCEIVTALQVLAEGGTFIFKLFTFFEHCTINLLYLVNYCFEKVHLFKPVTSKLGNSEVYVICLKFRGHSIVAPFIKHLQSAFGTDLYKEFTLFPQHIIPSEFINSLYEYAKILSQLQCLVINDNLKSFQKKVFNNDRIKYHKENVSKQFIIYYDLRPIEPRLTILNQLDYKEDKMNQFLKKRHKGSYNSRLSLRNEGPGTKVRELLWELDHEVTPLVKELSKNRSVDIFHSADSLSVSMTYGRPICKLLSSQFIYLPVLRLYQKIIEIKEFRELILKDCEYNKDVTVEVCDNEYTLTFPDYNIEECYNSFEKRCCKRLLETINQIKSNNNLIIKNFNLLTLFNVSLLNLLYRNSFKSITFTKDNEVVLSNFCEWKLDVDVESLNENDKIQILNMLPVKDIIGDSLYDAIVLHNNEEYWSRCRNYLEIIRKEYEDVN